MKIAAAYEILSDEEVRVSTPKPITRRIHQTCPLHKPHSETEGEHDHTSSCARLLLKSGIIHGFERGGPHTRARAHTHLQTRGKYDRGEDVSGNRGGQQQHQVELCLVWCSALWCGVVLVMNLAEKK